MYRSQDTAVKGHFFNGVTGGWFGIQHHWVVSPVRWLFCSHLGAFFYAHFAIHSQRPASQSLPLWGRWIAEGETKELRYKFAITQIPRQIRKNLRMDVPPKPSKHSWKLGPSRPQFPDGPSRRPVPTKGFRIYRKRLPCQGSLWDALYKRNTLPVCRRWSRSPIRAFRKAYCFSPVQWPV